jgi:5'(3')-deoxyribonucleotidase
MGFFERDTRKHIHVSKSIYQPMLKIFEKCEDKNLIDADLIIDGGVSNIAQFIAST